MTKTIKKYFINILLIILFAFVAVYLSVKDEFTEIISLIKNINVFSILIILLIALLPLLIEGYILRTFCSIYNKRLKISQGIENSFIGALFSGLTPFASGGQFVQAFHFAKCGLNMTASISVLLMDFLVYQTALVLYTFVILVLKYSLYAKTITSMFALSFIGFLINLFVITILFLAAKSKKVQLFVTDIVFKLLFKLKIVKDYQTRKAAFEAKITQFRKDIKILMRNKGILIKTFILACIRLTITFSIPYFCMRILDNNINISIFDCICITAFISMITAFIPIPGASGGSEGVYVLLFGAFVSKTIASSSMLIWRFVTYYLILCIGAAFFFWCKRKYDLFERK